jgi:2,3-bisphosphoglycerate-dependent phosphoglycerate mutase
MKRIFVITHTESFHQVQGLGGGWFDTSLTERGRQQAKIIAERLHETVKAAGIPIYCSDLKRAFETADIFKEVFHGQVFKDRRLREMCFGDAEGKDKDWQLANFRPPSTTARMDHRVYENSESRRELAGRILNFMGYLEDHLSEETIIVTHGFALTFVILSWLKIPVDAMGFANFKGSPGGVTLLEEDDVYRNRGVSYLNSTEFVDQ